MHQIPPPRSLMDAIWAVSRGGCAALDGHPQNSFVIWRGGGCGRNCREGRHEHHGERIARGRCRLDGQGARSMNKKTRMGVAVALLAFESFAALPAYDTLPAYNAELRPVKFWQEHGKSENCVRVDDAKPSATNGAFRIMSYNIQMSYGIDGKLDPVRTAERILSESPDFVCVQEVWNSARFKQLTGLLGMHGAFTHRDRCVGNAVYSHVKPLKVEAFELPSSKYKRTLLICEFKDFAVASMHLDLDAGKRLESVPVVRKALARYKKPVFIAGDWNNWPNTRVLKGLKEFVTVISPEHGIHTFHKRTLNRKECVIDYIAVDKAHAGDFSISGAWEVPDRITSDHSPIVVELAFAGKE